MKVLSNRVVVALMAGAVSFAVNGPAAASVSVMLQPNEADSDDVFSYQFAGAGFGIAPSAADSNLDTDTVGAPIGLLLGTSRSETTTHSIDANGELPSSPTFDANTAVDVDTGHDGVSFLKFDLSGIPAEPHLRAKLSLYALDGFALTGAFGNPTAQTPVETEVYGAADSWDEQTLKWTNQDPAVPAFGSPVDTVTQKGVNRWVNFDVTSLVNGWLADPSSNNGFFLRQKDIVLASNPQDLGGLTGVVSSLYASSWLGDPAAPAGFDLPEQQLLRPTLMIFTVPEPVTAAFGLMGLGALGVATRRRSA